MRTLFIAVALASLTTLTGCPINNDDGPVVDAFYTTDAYGNRVYYTYDAYGNIIYFN